MSAHTTREILGLNVLEYKTKSGTKIIHDTRNGTYNRFSGTMLLRVGVNLVDSISGKEMPDTSLGLYMYEGTRSGKDRYNLPEIGDVIIGGIPIGPQHPIYTSTELVEIKALTGKEREDAIKDLEILYKSKLLEV